MTSEKSVADRVAALRQRLDAATARGDKEVAKRLSREGSGWLRVGAEETLLTRVCLQVNSSGAWLMNADPMVRLEGEALMLDNLESFRAAVLEPLEWPRIFFERLTDPVAFAPGSRVLTSVVKRRVRLRFEGTLIAVTDDGPETRVPGALEAECEPYFGDD